MAARVNNAYTRSANRDVERVVVMMPREETAAIDGWAVPAGMPSRTSAVRHLLRKGLEAMRAEQDRIAVD